MQEFHETVRFDQKSHILKISHIWENPKKNLIFPKMGHFQLQDLYQNITFPIPHGGGRNTCTPLMNEITRRRQQ